MPSVGFNTASAGWWADIRVVLIKKKITKVDINLFARVYLNRVFVEIFMVEGIRTTLPLEICKFCYSFMDC